MTVLDIESESDFVHQLEQAGDKVVICDFWASYCGPCLQIAPVYKELSDQYPEVIFLKVDAQKLSSLAAKENVMFLPTFKTYKNKQPLSTFTGADKTRIVDVLENDGVATLPPPKNINYGQIFSFIILMIYIFYKCDVGTQISDIFSKFL